jgi:hypothetical protein
MNCFSKNDIIDRTTKDSAKRIGAIHLEKEISLKT